MTPWECYQFLFSNGPFWLAAEASDEALSLIASNPDMPLTEVLRVVASARACEVPAFNHALPKMAETARPLTAS